MRVFIFCVLLLLVPSLSTAASNNAKQIQVYCGKEWITFQVYGIHKEGEFKAYDENVVVTHRKSDIGWIIGANDGWRINMKNTTSADFQATVDIRDEIIRCLN